MKFTSLITAMAILGMLVPVGANAGDAWNCQGVTTGVGTWEIQGNELVSPPGDFGPQRDRIPIVKNDSKAVVGFLDTKYDRFELVMIDKRSLVIKIVALSINGAYKDHVQGTCKPARQRHK